MSVLKNSRSSSSLSWSSVFFGTFRTFSRAAPSLLSFCREAKEHCCARCRNDGPGDRLMQDRGLGLEWAERRACLLAAKTERCATSNTRARRASCHEISRSISTLVGGLSSLATDLSDGPTLFTPHGAKPASRTEVAPAKSPPQWHSLMIRFWTPARWGVRLVSFVFIKFVWHRIRANAAQTSFFLLSEAEQRENKPVQAFTLLRQCISNTKCSARLPLMQQQDCIAALHSIERRAQQAKLAGWSPFAKWHNYSRGIFRDATSWNIFFSGGGGG